QRRYHRRNSSRRRAEPLNVTRPTAIVDRFELSIPLVRRRKPEFYVDQRIFGGFQHGNDVAVCRRNDGLGWFTVCGSRCRLRCRSLSSGWSLNWLKDSFGNELCFRYSRIGELDGL